MAQLCNHIYKVGIHKLFMVESFWKPKSKIKTATILSKKYPRRTITENRLIDRHPYKDSDRDRVLNYFDCKPMNRKKRDAWQEIQKGGQFAAQAIRVPIQGWQNILQKSGEGWQKIGGETYEHIIKPAEGILVSKKVEPQKVAAPSPGVFHPLQSQPTATPPLSEAEIQKKFGEIIQREQQRTIAEKVLPRPAPSPVMQKFVRVPPPPTTIIEGVKGIRKLSPGVQKQILSEMQRIQQERISGGRKV